MPIKFDKLTILVVEDTIPMQKLITSVLDSLGVGHIYAASDGLKGYQRFKEINPDIVIADWHMEPMTGIELTQKIRKSSDSPNRMTPVILVTGYSAMSRVSEARDSGVTEFLVKPFSAADLAKRIAYVINKPRDYIDYGAYFGPDRRRRNAPDGTTPNRRNTDRGSSGWDGKDVED